MRTASAADHTLPACATANVYTVGTSFTFFRRERPELRTNAAGDPTHLITGVEYPADEPGKPTNHEYSFTLVQEVDLSGGYVPQMAPLKHDDDSEQRLQGATDRTRVARRQKIVCDSDDCTAVLQAAVNSGASEVELQPGLWTVSPIYLNASHQRVTLLAGVHVQAKRWSFHSPLDCLFSIRAVVNVSIVGAGASESKLSMWKRDYRNASLYERGEWRVCVTIMGSKHITVANITISDTGGDGVYVGAMKLGGDRFDTGCSDVLLHGVVTDRAYRNGLSLISGTNVLVEDCQFLRTSGTAPQAGIDIEPNGCPSKSECEKDALSNVTFRNVTSRWNNGAGLQFELYALKPPEATAVSITVDGMVIQGIATTPSAVAADPLNGTYNIGIDVAAVEPGGATGSIVISACYHWSAQSHSCVQHAAHRLACPRAQNTAKLTGWFGRRLPLQEMSMCLTPCSRASRSRTKCP